MCAWKYNWLDRMNRALYEFPQKISGTSMTVQAPCWKSMVLWTDFSFLFASQPLPFIYLFMFLLLSLQFFGGTESGRSSPYYSQLDIKPSPVQTPIHFHIPGRSLCIQQHGLNALDKIIAFLFCIKLIVSNVKLHTTKINSCDSETCSFGVKGNNLNHFDSEI